MVDKGMNSGCRVLRVGVVLFMAIFLAVNVVKSNPENLRSLVGLVGFIVLLFLFSQNPARVKSCISISCLSPRLTILPSVPYQKALGLHGITDSVNLGTEFFWDGMAVTEQYLQLFM